jgi:SulP family sulfate permease
MSEITPMFKKFIFSRTELAGSLADLGTMLPIAGGMIVANGLEPAGIFFSVGAFYILSGLYFGVTMPVQPMKLIGAYAIAMGYDAGVVSASVLMMGIVLLFIGMAGIAKLIDKYVPKSVVRGVQVSAGVLLAVEGIKFILGTTKFQSLESEPYLMLQHIGAIPIGIILGIISLILILLLLENKKMPAAIAVISAGMLAGIFFGTHEGFDQISFFSLPKILPFDIPSADMLLISLTSLVMPQLPLSLGNSVISAPDLAGRYFGENAKKVTPKAVSISMGLANIAAFFVGGMPLCHGSGGLAAHYRFGSRTAGTNLMIGSIFLLLAIFLGEHSTYIINLLPLSVLGILLTFAGIELTLMIKDLKERNDLFVVFTMTAVTLAANLAPALVIGFLLSFILKTKKLNL